MNGKFLIRTFGCQMNEHDSERLAGLLVAEGMEPTQDAEDADVVLLNTCCIRENADNRLYGTLGHLKSLQARKPGMQIAVGGCLAQKDRGTIQERAGYVDVVFGTHNIDRAAALLSQSRATGAAVMEILDQAVLDEDTAFPSALPAQRNSDISAWVTVQIGCDNNCAFCIVPSVRGREISRPFGEIVAEVEGLARVGVSEVTLLGQNVNSYGRDITSALRKTFRDGEGDLADADRASPMWRAGAGWAGSGSRRPRPLFADLLRAVGAVEGIDRVRFTSPHPKDLRPETIAAMAETRSVCEHLHLPLQSGSDEVLARMHRGYTAARYLERLARARSEVVDLAVTTDIIVGFPGESDKDFAATLEVAAEVGYDSAYTFIYSPRPGTQAAAMTDRFVDPSVVADRFERLKVVLERSALSRHRERIDRVEEVLVEGPSKRDGAMLTGRTRQNKLLHFPDPDPDRDPDRDRDRDRGPDPNADRPAGPGGHAGIDPSAPAQVRRGSVVHVRVTGAAPHHLTGELVARPAPSRSSGHRRLSIPVRAG
ncbi:MAG: MiaB/RimO family radical SAM methylthiotransferase [Acidimicrobiales bacterium]